MKKKDKLSIDMSYVGDFWNVLHSLHSKQPNLALLVFEWKYIIWLNQKVFFNQTSHKYLKYVPTESYTLSKGS